MQSTAASIEFVDKTILSSQENTVECTATHSSVCIVSGADDKLTMTEFGARSSHLCNTQCQDSWRVVRRSAQPRRSRVRTSTDLCTRPSRLRCSSRPFRAWVPCGGGRLKTSAAHKITLRLASRSLALPRSSHVEGRDASGILVVRGARAHSSRCGWMRPAR